LHGKVKLFETSKSELIELWNSIIKKNNITINQLEKVISINKEKSSFFVETNKGKYESKSILIAIGRRGSPRKLGVTGEEKEKVFYRLLEPELIRNSKIVVVGGGDSAVESALLLAQNKNEVTVSYRNETFSRLKPMNVQRINEAVDSSRIKVVFNSNVVEIKEKSILLKYDKDKSVEEIENDLVFIFAGGELPTKFLESVGISITKKFGEPLLSNSKN
ncbi:MAG TPA: NAD(P)-binding domain-containing protein, partial [Ignavibacteriaceae bacterium]|nr:NAD(P)-binding domain-containing protein [Ignavibacteriaceae bacterium]